MKLRSFLVTVSVLSILAVGFVYRQGADAAPPPQSTRTSSAVFAEDIEVTIRVTGIAHLMGDYGAKERTLIIPNHKNSDHELLVLVEDKFESELLNEKRTVRPAGGGSGPTYAYDQFPDGYEVDLAASGWVPPKTVGTLDVDESGDSTNEPCPTGTVVKDSLHWLPRMSKVNLDAAQMKDSHKKKDPKPKHVLARMEITDGKLRSALQPSARKFEFDTNGMTGTNDSDIVQAVADYLVYKFTARVVKGQPFVLKGRKFQNKKNEASEWKEIVRVKPVSGGVEITLANIVEDDFFEPEKITEIEHFHHFYNAYHKPKKNIRKVTAGKACGDGADSGVECGPVRP